MPAELSLVALFAAMGIAAYFVGRHRHRILQALSARSGPGPAENRLEPQRTEHGLSGNELQLLAAERKSEAEMERIQTLIDARKQVARETDISYHLWSLYESLFRTTTSPSPDRHPRNGNWYDVRILNASTEQGLNSFVFELMGNRYRLVDDEDKQGWREHTKLFSLFLYDESDRCLVEVPMKLRVHGSGRSYSILSHGPEAFLQGTWLGDFINVSLKHQSLRNQDIRMQKLKERLSEIEEMKDRFGIAE